MASKKQVSKPLSELSDEVLNERVRCIPGVIEMWEYRLSRGLDGKELEKAQECYKYCCEEQEKLHAERARRNGTYLTNGMLERAAQEVIGELEMDALLLTHDPDVEVIRCTRIDGSTYLTTRKRVLVHA